MKAEIPWGDYNITLEHHPNQREGLFLATIVDGKYAGKSFLFRCDKTPWIDPTIRTFRGGRNEN